MDNSIEISGQTILPGTPVNIKWLHNWYEGEVLELGHQNDLYKIKDTSSDLNILLEKSQFKVIDASQPTHNQFCPGSAIAYYDNGLCTWVTGSIEDRVTEEVVLVKWRRESSSNANINWFEVTDVAPIISNEAFGIEVVDELPSKSKLQLPSMTKIPLLEDVLDERPRHRKNSMFQGTAPVIESQMPFENRLPSYDKFLEELDSPNRVKGHRTSVSMKRYYSENFTNKLSQHNDSTLERYLQNQAALLHGKMDHSLLPPVWSYLSQPKGIPHHPSSRFFRHVTSDSCLPHSSGQYYGSQGWVRSSDQQIPVKRTRSEYFKPNLSKSPTMISEPKSEPSPYAELNFPPRSLKHHASDMSARPLPALPDETTSPSSPYEVPLPLSSPASWASLHQKAKPNTYIPRLEKFDEVTPMDVKAPTIVSTSKNEMMVSAGGSITLFCEANSDTPITFEWSRNGQQLTNNDDRVAFPSPGYLQLYGLCVADSGTYQCKVSNIGGTATYKSKLYVEEESLKRSFSREYGLDNLAKDLPQFEDKQNDSSEIEELSLSSISLNEPDNDFSSQAPAYDNYPLNMVRHTLSLASMNAAIEQEEQSESIKVHNDQSEEKKKKKSTNKKRLKEERKTNKDKRKRVSNVLMNDVQDYLGGYGADYGHMTDEMILALGIDSEKKEKGRSSKKKLKKNKKKKTKSNTKVEEKERVALASKEKRLITPEPPPLTDTAGLVNVGKGPYPLVSVEGELVLEYEEGMIREEGEGEESQSHVGTDTVQDWTSPNEMKEACSRDSIDAHPSFESLLDNDNESENFEPNSKEREAGEGKEHDSDINLPSDTRHYTEAVRRLQESAQEYEQQHGFGKEEDKKSRRVGFGKLFKSSSKQENKLTMI